MSAHEIKKKALQMGYVSCGIIPSITFDEYNKYLDERVSSFPDSEEKYKRFYNYVQPPEFAKSIIVCVQRINQYKVPESLNGRVGKNYLFDSRLPFVHEYRARQEFEAYIKTLGINILEFIVPERWAAVKAGLVKFGRNNFVYTDEHGSYIRIHVWVVDKELEYDAISQDTLMPGCSEDCLICVRECPTQALSGSFSMDLVKCVTQLSTFATDIPSETERSQMGLWLYGCDVCQDVCPMNKDKMLESEEFTLLANYEEYLTPERVLAMDEDTYINVVNPRFWYMGKDGLWLWKCNALRIMINSGKTEYHHIIKEHCNHEDARLKEIALWGCRKLGIS